ncbi:MAG: DUF5716 family protein [Opitutaceae bacterium]|jgi:hypothetical protein|nr:DUF5716 family protein [Opitutaceae bacterium]
MRLTPWLKGNFFRPLGRRSAAVYVDCAEKLVGVSDETGIISFEDTRNIIREIISSHPDIVLDEDEGGRFPDLVQRAGQFYNRLCEAGWLHERRLSLRERQVLVVPALRMLVDFLENITRRNHSDLRDFAGTLRSVCDALNNPDALNPDNPDNSSGENFRLKIRDLIDRADHAKRQLYAVENIILDYEARQQESSSAGETLHRALVQFHEGGHIVCYDVLAETGLHERINRARDVAREAADDYLVKQHLARGIAGQEDMTENDAFLEAGSRLQKLERLLATVLGAQHAIDGRISDFSTLSAARYRYQTEMRGRQADLVQKFLEAAANGATAQSFVSLALPLALRIRSIETKTYLGGDSLYAARRRRAPASLDFDIPDENTAADRAGLIDSLRRQHLNQLSPRRALRFVEKHLPAKGASVSTETLRVETHEALLDFLSVLCFDSAAPSSASGSRRTVRWRVIPATSAIVAPDGSDPATPRCAVPLRDDLGMLFSERLAIERIA